jgi:hypothetical protein
MPRRLSYYDAWEMRVLRATTNVSRDILADMYQVSKTAVGEIIRGRSYQAAGGPIEPLGMRGNRLKHGTAWGIQWGCTCELCREANAAKSRAYRARKKEEKLAATGDAP